MNSEYGEMNLALDEYYIWDINFANFSYLDPKEVVQAKFKQEEHSWFLYKSKQLRCHILFLYISLNELQHIQHELHWDFIQEVKI